jgi:hypothetical protein
MNTKPLHLVPTGFDGLLFTPAKKRIASIANPKNKSGFSYVMEVDKKTSKTDFNALLKKIPANPGFLVLYGVTRTGATPIIGIIRSNVNLREAFSVRNNSISGFAWCMEKIEENYFSGIKIQLAFQSN